MGRGSARDPVVTSARRVALKEECMGHDLGGMRAGDRVVGAEVAVDVE
jgi:hypothetical protein